MMTNDNVSDKVVWYNIGVDTPCTPDTPLPALPEGMFGKLLVLTGRAPIWRYALAMDKVYQTKEESLLSDSDNSDNLAYPAAMACYDPRLGAVVFQAASTLDWHVGQVLSIEPPANV